MSIETKTTKQYKTVRGYKINLATGVTELTTNQVTAFNTNLDVIKSAGLDIDFDTFVTQNLSKLLGTDFNGKFIISEGKGVSANTPVMDRINAKIEELKKDARDSGEAFYVNGKTIFLDANHKPKELSTTFCKRTPKGQDPVDYENELLKAIGNTVSTLREEITEAIGEDEIERRLKKQKTEKKINNPLDQ